MKTSNQKIALILLISSVIIFVSCRKTDIDAAQLGTCKKIVISDDTDVTELNFNEKGELAQLYGQQLTEFYKTGFLSIQVTENDNIIKLNKEIFGWSMSIKDISGDGIENVYFTDNNGKGNKVTGLKSFGTDSQGDAFLITENYSYDASGDCSARIGTVMIDNQVVGKYSSTYKYSSKVSPFSNNPFQWLIEAEWSGGGHTNKHLTEIENHIINNIDDDRDSKIEMDISYDYTFDKKGRLESILIVKHQFTTVKVLSTGQVFTDNDKTISYINFSYEC